MELLAAFGLSMIGSILVIAIGLGLVIFFHELGHFAVAKWCDVKVERFSIGFGPILLRWKWGETEYALSAVPFGGYVKMLGQDDMDPSQLTSEEIAADPRSYMAKNVPQRMAIISAGVIMNVITGMIFYALAFGIGVEHLSAVVGGAQIGYPAWTAGIEEGDEITRINGEDVDSFHDIMRGVTLTSGKVRVEGVKPDGTEFDVTLTPNDEGTRRIIGVGFSHGLRIVDNESVPVALPGTPAATAEPELQHGDLVRRVGETEVDSYYELHRLFAERRDESVDLSVQRKGDPSGDLVRVRVPPQPFRTLGLNLEVGRIAAVQEGSPAARAEQPLKPGDRITHVNGKRVGITNVDRGEEEIDTLHLPDVFASPELRGKDVTITFTRETRGGSREEFETTVVPDDQIGWTEPPGGPDVPLAIPAIGVAFHVIPQVLSVEPDGPADGKVPPNATIEKIELFLPEDAEPDTVEEAVFELGGEQQHEDNMAYAFWMMQRLATRHARLTLALPDGEKKEVVVEPAEARDWYVPDVRGLHFGLLTKQFHAENVPHAFQLGFDRAREDMVGIYLTLRGLGTGGISPKELHGPIGIATVAYQAAQQGLSKLLPFLGFLSINLAVLNFLPIPVLDGGHMVFLIWEGIARRKPSERVVAAATYVGLAFVLSLMVFVLFLDFGRLLGG